MTQKDIAKPPAGAAGLTIEDIYNLLMAEIEPDLTTHMIPVLDELYAEESAAERKERLEGYAKSFEEFAEKFEKAMRAWKEALMKWQERLMSLLKKRGAEKDEQALLDIERSLDAP